MAAKDIIVIGTGDSEEDVRRAIDRSVGGSQQRRYHRFLMAALGSIPWVGGVISATAALSADSDQDKLNELQKEWLEEHRQKLAELGKTLAEVVDRLESLGEDIQRRMESQAYLALVRRAFRTWDEADTDEKRRLVKNLLTNAGGTTLCPDDLVRLFIQWIDYYHEAHFAVIRAIFASPGSTRADVWDSVHGEAVRENSAEADLFRLLFRDLSMGGVIRQHRDTTPDGHFVKKPTVRSPRGIGARVMKSAFDDTERYELTELGSQFIHYTMNEVVPRIDTGGQST
jgi:hypothetical protein